MNTARERIVALAVPNSTGCWLLPHKPMRDGYVRIRVGTGKQVLAHRAAYEAFIGPIPDGMEVDHSCWERGCCNPDHLGLLTPLENKRRQRSALAGACSRGHELSGHNLIIRSNGTARQCRKCSYEYIRLYNERRKAAA
jgi:hypothetical protein